MAKATKRAPSPAPAGSAQTVDATRARCPHCGSSKAEVLRSLPPTDHQAFYGGLPYTRVERRRMRCQSCDHGFVRREHTFDPKVWRGPRVAGLLTAS